MVKHQLIKPMKLHPCAGRKGWLFSATLVAVLMLLSAGMARAAADLPKAAATNAFPSRLLSFCTVKEQQARKLAEQGELKISSQIWDYFQAAKDGDWPAVSNLFERVKKRANQYEGAIDDKTVGTPVFQTLIEIQTAYEAFALGDPKYAFAFGDGIIESIPRGSIYFGGTDPGRGLVTALCRSHEEGDPFFTITQNALADARYLSYLQSMYGQRLRMPTTEDSQKAFSEYLADAQRRLEHDRKFPGEPRQMKPGEDVRLVDNRVQVSGQVAVMQINGLITKMIFDQNTNREFYVEESFPLEWMNPHLAPHQLILRLRRQPWGEFTTEMMDQDRAFWTGQVGAMLGAWLKPETSVRDVCAFAEKVYVNKDLAGFSGDARYVANTNVCKTFSKLRSSIAGVYTWRLTAKDDRTDKARLKAEADLAYRQAFVLCPFSPEAVYRYVSFLVSQDRLEDALRIARTAWKLEPENGQLQNLIDELLRSRAKKEKENDKAR